MSRCAFINTCSFKYCLDNNECLHAALDGDRVLRPLSPQGSKVKKQRALVRGEVVYEYGDFKYASCHYCGGMFRLNGPAKGRLTKDHVIPKSKGGKHLRHNKVLACASCNGEKADMDYMEYLKLRIESGRTLGSVARRRYLKLIK